MILLLLSFYFSLVLHDISSPILLYATLLYPNILDVSFDTAISFIFLIKSVKLLFEHIHIHTIYILNIYVFNVCIKYIYISI